MKYYAIIGKHTKKVIGYCTSRGVKDVLVEEPGCILEEITKAEYERNTQHNE